MPRISCVLVTGGCGYVGVHVVITLLKQGYDCVVLDNFANATPDARMKGGPSLQRVEELTSKKVSFEFADLTDMASLQRVFSTHKIDCVVHQAALKSVTESLTDSFNYYKSNVGGLMNLLEVMQQYKCQRLLLGSDTCVYTAQPNAEPIKETTGKTPLASTPYARTKQIQERILMDMASAAPKSWTFVVLRCGQVAGGHASGRLGYCYVNDGSHDLFPSITRVAVGKEKTLKVYGKDLPTKDGTAVRDYIHVMDLARGFAAALRALERATNCPIKIYNITSGIGYSVLDVVQSFERTSGKKIPLEYKPVKYEVPASVVCDASLALKDLQWKSEYSIDKMCSHSWKWGLENPDGYPEPISRRTSMKIAGAHRQRHGSVSRERDTNSK